MIKWHFKTMATLHNSYTITITRQHVEFACFIFFLPNASCEGESIGSAQRLNRLWRADFWNWQVLVLELQITKIHFSWKNSDVQSQIGKFKIVPIWRSVLNKFQTRFLSLLNFVSRISGAVRKTLYCLFNERISELN